MRYPEELHVDSGTEFKGEVLKLMKEHDVTVKGASPQIYRLCREF